MLDPHGHRLQALEQRPRVERRSAPDRCAASASAPARRCTPCRRGSRRRAPGPGRRCAWCRSRPPRRRPSGSPLQQRGGKDVVQHHFCPGRMRHLAHGGDVHQRLHRVGRRLEEHRLWWARTAPAPTATDRRRRRTPSPRPSAAGSRCTPRSTSRTGCAPRPGGRRPPSSAPSEVKTADMPVAVAKHAGAPSISRSRSWNIEIVGLPYRE